MFFMSFIGSIFSAFAIATSHAFAPVFGAMVKPMQLFFALLFKFF